MSQKAVLVRVNGMLHTEVYSSVPDYEDAIQICKDCGYEEECVEDSILVEYEWLDIGDGESGADDFFDDSQLCQIYDSDEYEKAFEKLGYSVQTMETGSYEIDYKELED